MNYLNSNVDHFFVPVKYWKHMKCHVCLPVLFILRILNRLSDLDQILHLFTLIYFVSFQQLQLSQLYNPESLKRGVKKHFTRLQCHLAALSIISMRIFPITITFCSCFPPGRVESYCQLLHKKLAEQANFIPVFFFLVNISEIFVKLILIRRYVYKYSRPGNAMPNRLENRFSKQ